MSKVDHTPISMVWSYCRPNVYHAVPGEIFQYPCPKCHAPHGWITKCGQRRQNGQTGVQTTHTRCAISCRSCGFVAESHWHWGRIQDSWIFPEGKPDERPIPSWMIGPQYTNRLRRSTNSANFTNNSGAAAKSDKFREVRT